MAEGKEKVFDPYEFAAIVVPGASLLFGLLVMRPDLAPKVELEKVSLGGLGLFGIAAFCAGHVLQSIGNLFETAYWKCWRGWPTDRMKSFVPTVQRRAFAARVRARMSLDAFDDIDDVSLKDWRAIRAQMVAAVQAAARGAMLEKHVGTYGLHRGLAVAALIFAAAAIVVRHAQWAPLALIGFAIFLLAAARMHRFGDHYARELYSQFMQLDDIEDASE